ncbi:sulfotransferase family 2 domain-containing protein [Coraliomargarita sp. SDUM461003]|uniref:Sulfotransferase family 2 domain-containing protein n=1 Tax=Thalassobacterium maritimum TaxID=3041265 RepID=A0ABU1AWP2_9BACT|nr:sulfotransferase family 2 domain-containing protein [Coraliomargarita sp. SDUM461003]MDQ8208555.1 sulfotransferase family 2 domain-containing protein [Coraliomargarita sp. SDUM461003]
MRILHSQKLVFLSMPRAGSTTVRNTLDQYSDVKSVHVSKVDADFPFFHHMTASELKAAFEAKGWQWDDYRKFCVVRNPYDRLVSLYHLSLNILANQRKQSLKGRLMARFGSVPTFEDYLYAINTNSHLPCTFKFFACAPDGEVLIDDLLKFENLSTELSDYLTQRGIPTQEQEVPRLNASEDRRKYRSYYDDKSRQFVAEKFGEEIDRFGYEF